MEAEEAVLVEESITSEDKETTRLCLLDEQTTGTARNYDYKQTEHQEEDCDDKVERLENEVEASDEPHSLKSADGKRTDLSDELTFGGNEVVTNSSHKCQLCDASFSIRSELDRHIDEGHDPFDEAFQGDGNLQSEPVYGKEDINVCLCPFCHQLLGSEDSLKRHLISCHLEEKTSSKWTRSKKTSDKTEDEQKDRPSDELDFRCHLCKKSYINKKQLDRHIITHTKTTMFKCPFCPNTFDFAADLRKHFKAHPVKSLDDFYMEDLKIDLATIAKSSGIDMSSSSNVQDLISDYKCPFCPSTVYAWFNSLRKHMEKDHPMVSVTSVKPKDCRVKQGSHDVREKFSCDFCGFSTTTFVTLKQHINTKHVKDAFENPGDHEPVAEDDGDDAESRKFMYKCPHCEGCISVYFSNLKRHISRKHPKEMRQNMVGKDFRIAVKAYSDGLNVEDEGNGDKVKYKCQHCHESEYSLFSSLRKHLSEKHGIDAVERLGSEDFSVTVEKNVIKDMADHEGQVKYKCPHCDCSSFTSIAGLKEHLTTKHPLQLTDQVSVTGQGLMLKEQAANQETNHNAERLSVQKSGITISQNIGRASVSRSVIVTDDDHDHGEYLEASKGSEDSENDEISELKKSKRQSVKRLYKEKPVDISKASFSRDPVLPEYKCPVCSGLFSRFSSLKLHFNRRHPKESDETLNPETTVVVKLEEDVAETGTGTVAQEDKTVERIVGKFDGSLGKTKRFSSWKSRNSCGTEPLDISVVKLPGSSSKRVASKRKLEVAIIPMPTPKKSRIEIDVLHNTMNSSDENGEILSSEDVTTLISNTEDGYRCLLCSHVFRRMSAVKFHLDHSHKRKKYLEVDVETKSDRSKEAKKPGLVGRSKGKKSGGVDRSEETKSPFVSRSEEKKKSGILHKSKEDKKSRLEDRYKRKKSGLTARSEEKKSGIADWSKEKKFEEVYLDNLNVGKLSGRKIVNVSQVKSSKKSKESQMVEKVIIKEEVFMTESGDVEEGWAVEEDDVDWDDDWKPDDYDYSGEEDVGKSLELKLRRSTRSKRSRSEKLKLDSGVQIDTKTEKTGTDKRTEVKKRQDGGKGCQGAGLGNIDRTDAVMEDNSYTAGTLNDIRGDQDSFTLPSLMVPCREFPFYINKHYKQLQSQNKEVKMYQCSYCDQRSSQTFTIRRHIGRVHRDAVNGNKNREVSKEQEERPLDKDNDGNIHTCHELGEELSEVEEGLDDNEQSADGIKDNQHTGFAGRVGEDFMSGVNDEGQEEFSCVHCPHKTVRHDGIRRHIYHFHLEEVSVDSIGLKKDRIPGPYGVEGKDFSIVKSGNIQSGVEDIKYRCHKCPFTTKWRNVVRTHLFRYHADFTEENDLEDEEEESVKDRKVKVYIGKVGKDYVVKNLEDGEKQFQCLHCDHVTVTRWGVTKHIYYRHMESVWTEDQMREHEKFYSESEKTAGTAGKDYKTVTLVNGDTKYQCLHCSKIDKWRGTIRRHIFRNHMDSVENKVQKRPKSNLKSKWADKLAGKLGTDYSVVNCSSEKMIFQCLICSQVLSSDHILKRHLLHTHYDRINKKPLLAVSVTSSKLCKFRATESTEKAESGLADNIEGSFTSVLSSAKDISEMSEVEMEAGTRSEDGTMETTSEELQPGSVPITSPKLPLHKTELSRRQKVLMKRRQVTCQLCNKMLPTTRAMKVHMKTDHKDHKLQPFTCETCGVSYVNKHSLLYHQMTKHSDKQKEYQCDECSHLFYKKGQLERHIRLCHLNEFSCVCDICGMGLKNKYCLIHHQARKHKDEIDAKDIPAQYEEATCEICDVKFATRKNYVLHKNKFHSGKLEAQEVNSCNMCNRNFETLGHLKQHVRKVHFNKEEAVKGGKERNRGGKASAVVRMANAGTGTESDSPQGSQVFLPKWAAVESSGLAGYRKVNTKRPWNKQVMCKLCKKEFSSVKRCNGHIRRTHVRDEDKPFRCKVCGRGFILMLEFQRHSRVHTNARPFKCNLCGKAFKQRSHLTDHERSHQQNKGYKCALCPQRFNVAGAMHTHIMRHSKIRPFTCPFCSYTSADRGNLTRHMVRYTSDGKSVPCHICFKEFKFNVQLQKHLETHEPENFFNCSVCDQSFSSYMYLYTHKKKNQHFTEEDYNAPEDFEDAEQMETDQSVRELIEKDESLKEMLKNGEDFVVEVVLNPNEEGHGIQYVHKALNTSAGASGKNEDDVENVVAITPEMNSHADSELLDIAKQLTQMSKSPARSVDVKRSVVQKEGPLKSHVQEENTQDFLDMLEADQDIMAAITQKRAQASTSISTESEIANTVYSAPVVPASGVMVQADASASTEGQIVVGSSGESVSTWGPALKSALTSSNSEGKQYSCVFEGDTLYLFEEEPEELTTELSTVVDPVEQSIIVTAIGAEKDLQEANQITGIFPEVSRPEGTAEIVQPLVQEKVQISDNAVIKHEEKDPDYSPHLGEEDSDSAAEEVTSNFTGSHNLVGNGYVVNNQSLSVGHTSVSVDGQTFVEEYYQTIKEQQANLQLDQRPRTSRKLSETDLRPRPYECRICPLKFHTKKYLNRHLQTHDPNRRKDFLCTECNKAFPHRSELTRHMRTHTDDKPHKCSVCKKGFRQGGHLAEHMRIHQGVMPHQCLDCGHSFRTKSSLTVHMQRKHSNITFKCDVCQDEGFKTKQEMLQHKVMKHTKLVQNSRLYEPKRSSSSKGSKNDQVPKKNQDRHSEADQMEANFVCDKCGKSFSTQQKLKSHFREHEKQPKIYSCHICGKQTKSLWSHLNSHNEVDRFKCQLCGKTYKKNRSFHHHIASCASRNLSSFNEVLVKVEN